MNNNQTGRSMIEMLGVLAIVAVLSVGGIAGYSKAMSVYKLNKWTYQIREMISNAQTQYINQKSYSGIKSGNILNTFISAGIIPEGMLDENNEDMFGNRLRITVNNKQEVISTLYLRYAFSMPVAKTSVDCCVKLYELGNYYNSLWLVAIENDFSYTNCGKATPLAYFEDQKCQPYDFIKAKQHCKKCEKQNCTMLVVMDNSVY